MKGKEKKRAGAFYKILRDFIGRSEEGRQIVTTFEADPDRGGADLAQYLRRHLPQEKQALADQLSRSLGQQDSAKFVNLVSGGHVDQILNIARVGLLQITVKKYFYLFSSVSQVVAALAIVILVGVGIAFGLWRSARPRMDGDFNIAVAKFVEESNMSDFDVAGSATKKIADFIDDEYDLSDFDIDVRYYGRVSVQGSEDAATLAHQVNAHLVIYGDVIVINDQATIAPKFYVTEAYQSDAREMSGEHSLELPVRFDVTDLLDSEAPVSADLPRRMVILTEFTKGLVYAAADDIPRSLQAMESAIKFVEEHEKETAEKGKPETVKGAEVIFLLASDNARRLGDLALAQQYADETLVRNPNYGRAYIALGNIPYEEGNYYAAEQIFLLAAGLQDQPPGAYVIEKANLSLCNIYQFEYQNISRNPDALPEEQEAMAQDGLTSCQVVIDCYEAVSRPDDRLTNLTAWAVYYTGIIYQFRGDHSLAKDAFERTLELTDDLGLQERAERRLNEVK